MTVQFVNFFKDVNKDRLEAKCFMLRERRKRFHLSSSPIPPYIKPTIMLTIILYRLDSGFLHTILWSQTSNFRYVNYTPIHFFKTVIFLLFSYFLFAEIKHIKKVVQNCCFCSINKLREIGNPFQQSIWKCNFDISRLKQELSNSALEYSEIWSKVPCIQNNIKIWL